MVQRAIGSSSPAAHLFLCCRNMVSIWLPSLVTTLLLLPPSCSSLVLPSSSGLSTNMPMMPVLPGYTSDMPKLCVRSQAVRV